MRHAGGHYPAAKLFQSLVILIAHSIGATWCSTPWWRRARSQRIRRSAQKTSPFTSAPQSVDASEAPYFVDLVRDQLNQKIGETDFNREGLRIYTSLDPDLQTCRIGSC